MKPLKFTMILLAFSFLAKANMSCIWTSHKAGITLSYVAPCNFSNKFPVDSILNIIIAQLNRQDTSLKVLALINFGRLSFSEDSLANFFSIGFDTLREIDDDYIFDYYWNQQSISADRNEGFNTFRSQDFPLDVNATNNKKALKTVGIKIIYDLDCRLGKPDWNDLIKAVVYALTHAEDIKKEQRRDTVRYNTNGWYVSLLTIDTFAINKIVGRHNESKKKQPGVQKPKPPGSFRLYGLLGLVLLVLIVYMGRSVFK